MICYNMLYKIHPATLYMFNISFSYFQEDAIVSQVLDELGIQMGAQLQVAPIGAASVVGCSQQMQQQQPAAAPIAADPAMDELEARLNNLRK
jgi:hypothetical protein